MIEPILNDEDRRIWAQWERASCAHSRTRLHAARVDSAKRYIDEMMIVAPCAYAAFSGGKDSTAMLYLLNDNGCSVRVMSVKDDLDFPGEEQFVRSTCERIGFNLDVLHPPFSLQDWLRHHAYELSADEDMHSRHAEFSKAAFYDVIEAYRELHDSPGVFLGLRKQESYGRLMNRVTHGAVYETKIGEWRCQPICDWHGIDVFAFLLSRDAPILDVYRCCRLHESPERIRKSWWLPGKSSRKNGMVWLKTYYPSLFRRLCSVLPDASASA